MPYFDDLLVHDDLFTVLDPVHKWEFVAGHIFPLVQGRQFQWELRQVAILVT